MQCELLDILPSFVQQYRASHPSMKEMAFGQVCTQLIHIVESIHQSKHILLDVKPDNLMISKNFTLGVFAKSKTKITTDYLATSIRLVDLGLLKSIMGPTGSHTENVPASEVQGTPLYSSLHVHNLQTPSRRDDVYAMLYVIGELILRVSGILDGKPAPYGSGTKSASYFQWSQEKSDAAIGKIKAEEMKSIKSAYFSSMPNTTIAKILFSAHQQVHDTNFAQKPNYDLICTALSNIKIPIPASYSSVTPSSTAKSSMKRAGDSHLVEPSKQLRRSARHDTPKNVVDMDCSARSFKTMKTSCLIECNASDSDDVIMYDASQGCESDESVEMMDVETDDCKPAALPSKERTPLQFTIEGGFVNEISSTIVLTEKNPTVVITSNSKLTETNVFLPDWSGTLRLTLSSKIPNTMNVDPKGKQTEVKVNKALVPLSGTVAFLGQTITFGPYMIRNFKKFDKMTAASQHVPKENVPSSKMNASIDSNIGRRGAKRGDHVAKNAPPQRSFPAPTNPFLVLKVTAPESIKGMTYVLEQNVSDSFTIGSGRSSNKDKSGWICFDPILHQIEPKHASVSLIVLKDGTLMVQVHDLKSDSGTYVSNTRVLSGKPQMAFCNQNIRTGNVTFVVANSV